MKIFRSILFGILGLAGIFAGVCIYLHTRKPFWSPTHWR